MNQTEKLIAYCLSSLSEFDRIEVEENLLNSKSWVSEFISVKRILESDEAFHAEPSAQLKRNLSREVEKTFMNKPILPWFEWLTLKPALGAAFALILIAVITNFLNHKSPPTLIEIKNGISVDAVNQSPLNSNFL